MPPISYYSCLLSPLQHNLCIWLKYHVGIFLMLIFTKFKLIWSSVEQHFQLCVGEGLYTSFPLPWRRAASLFGDERGHRTRMWVAIILGGVSGQMGPRSRISQAPNEGRRPAKWTREVVKSGIRLTAEMWGESVKVSAQSEGSWTMTGKPQGSLLTQHLCHDWGSDGAWNRGSSCAVRWIQVLRQEAGGHRRRKRWGLCCRASAPHIGSCEKALQRLKCRGKSIYFD